MKNLRVRAYLENLKTIKKGNVLLNFQFEGIETDIEAKELLPYVGHTFTFEQVDEVETSKDKEMCEPTGVRKALNQIPFKVSALATAFEPGSFERSLVESVCDSIRKDVEYIRKRLDDDLKD